MTVIVHQVKGEWVPFEGTPSLNLRKVTRLVDEGLWGEQELAAHGLKALTGFSPPEGEIPTGAVRIITDAKGQLAVERDTVPAPPAMLPKSQIIGGLSDQQLDAFFNAMSSRERAMWSCPDLQAIEEDDEGLVRWLAAARKGRIGEDGKL